MPSNYHYNKRLRPLARELRNNPTKAERRIWYELLSGRQFGGYQFLRQRIIDQYIVDFFCKELRLVIEIDGKTHEFEDVKQNDVVREKRLQSLGYSVVRFSDWEVLNNLGEVAELLTAEIEHLRKN